MVLRILRESFALFKDAAVAWGQDKGSLLAASLAYYTLFSLAPLLVISVAVAGFVFGEAAVEGQLVGQIEGVVGREIAITIQRIIENAAAVRTSGILATIIGVVVLFVGASGVFGQLKTALNMIWGISRQPGGGLLSVIKTRFLAFTMVLGIGFLLLLTVAMSVALSALRKYLATLSPALISNLPRLDIIAAMVVITILFAIVFRMLPDAEVAWRDVWLGAIVTALLFALGEYLIGLYLANSSIGSAYGAAGSLVVILVWIYYSAMILMYGAEFTKLYANCYGSKIRPAENARFVAAPPRSAAAKPLPAPPPPAAGAAPAAPSPGQTRRQIATGLIGLALGLLLAFVAGWRRHL
jgi:membrane protein